MNKSIKLILSSLILGFSLSSIKAVEPTKLDTSLMPVVIKDTVTIAPLSTLKTQSILSQFLGNAKKACTGLVTATPVLKNAITKTFNFIKNHPKAATAMIAGSAIFSYLCYKTYSWYKNKQTKTTKKPTKTKLEDTASAESKEPTTKELAGGEIQTGPAKK